MHGYFSITQHGYEKIITSDIFKLDFIAFEYIYRMKKNPFTYE